MHRISHPKHDEATRIEFLYEASEKLAREYEAQKIVELQPKYNRIGKLGTSYHLISG